MESLQKAGQKNTIGQVSKALDEDAPKKCWKTSYLVYSGVKTDKPGFIVKMLQYY